MICFEHYIFALSVTFGCICNTAAFQTKQNRPHIVFILADDLVSCLVEVIE